MKKIFTLFIALGLLTVADAQRGNQGNRGNNRNRGNVDVNVHIPGNNGMYQSRFAADRMLRQELARINFKYDRKVQQVRQSYFMFRGEKIRKIRRLEDLRQREINRAYARARLNGNWYGHTRRY